MSIMNLYKKVNVSHGIATVGAVEVKAHSVLGTAYKGGIQSYPFAVFSLSNEE